MGEMNASDNTQVVCKTVFCQNTIFLIKGNLKVLENILVNSMTQKVDPT